MRKFISKISILVFLAFIIPTNITFAQTSNTSLSYFEGIKLAESIPSIFYKNEVYAVTGKTTSSDYDTITIVMQKTDTDKTTSFTGQVINKKFSIPVFTPQPGGFYFGIILGNKGGSKAIKVNVHASLPIGETREEAPKIKSLNIGYEDDQTIAKISTTFPSLKRLTFIQGDKKITYLSRQNTSSIPINYKDFSSFLPGKVSMYAEAAKIAASPSITITSGFSKSGTKTFTAAEHAFSETDLQKITTNPPDTTKITREISFSGQVKTDTRIEAYVIKPNGFTDTLDLSTTSPQDTYEGEKTIKNGGDFIFSYSPSKKGRYIFEIIDKEGIPILNHPTYIGTGIPLIPDFFDLNERTLFTGTFNEKTLRKELLYLINKSRKQHGLSSVSTSTGLNNLAQKHSEDMAKNDYFSHFDKAGNSPEDRRLTMGIQTPVSENIAKDVSVKFAHEGLMRSASHRSNILQTDWTKVGLGIAEKNGYIYVTQEFSTSPLTALDLETKKTELFTTINNNRKANNATELTYSPSLELVCKQLNDTMVNTTSELSNNDLTEALDKFMIDGTTMAIGRSYNSWTPILDSLLAQESKIPEQKWKTIGIDIQVDKTGNITVLVVLNGQ
ncbi:MAG: CAP domain-containing protein [Candidatus Gracilibacteria bacterium]|jgi:uncharacterized protein YkwD